MNASLTLAQRKAADSVVEASPIDAMEPLPHSRTVCIALDWDDTLCPTTWLMQQKVDSAGNLSSKVRARVCVAFCAARGSRKGAPDLLCTAPPCALLTDCIAPPPRCALRL